ncbi:MAG TPA: glycosyltransferase family 4 protein [Candidatus Krumholzibacterium sp.]|nr:glycosyltransferase family 4 protein [Candidatus Krumholzibacterium sp.]
MESVAWDVASGLAGRGHRVRVVTTALPDGGGCDFPPAEPDGLDIVCLPGTAPGRYSLSWWRKSKRYFLDNRRDFSPEAVFSVSVGAGSVLPVLDGIPALMQVHGTSPGEFESKLRSMRPAALIRSPYNLLCIPRDLVFYRDVTRAVAVGPAVSAALAHPLIRTVLPGSKVSLIPNGIDTGLFSPRPAARRRVRAAYGIPPDAEVVISVSRLNVQKGVHLALEAFSRLDRRESRLLVAGEGPESGRLKQLAERTGTAGRVVFAGGVKQSVLPDLYAAADAFVFASTRVEGLPLNVLEAMSMGLPVAVSGHLVDSIEGMSAVTGVFRIDPGAPESISQGIASALDCSGSGRRAFVLGRYSKKKMLDSYERLLLEMTGG